MLWENLWKYYIPEIEMQGNIISPGMLQPIHLEHISSDLRLEISSKLKNVLY